MTYFPNSFECKCSPCQLSVKEELTLKFAIFFILGVSVSAGLGVHYLNHWTLKSSLLLGGSLTIGGCALEVALFVIFKQKKAENDSLYKLIQDEIIAPNKKTTTGIAIDALSDDRYSRCVFRVIEAQKVYYIKLESSWDKHITGRAHSLNDWLAYKIAKFLKIECVPQIWFFRSFDEFDASSEFSLEFKKAILSHEEIKSLLGPFVIQIGVEAIFPKSKNEKKKIVEEALIERKSAHEAFLSIILMGNWDACYANAPIDSYRKVQLIDNDNIGQAFESLEKGHLWLKRHKSSKDRFDEEIKAKFLKIEEQDLCNHLEEIKLNFHSLNIYIDPEFNRSITHNLIRLKKVLPLAKTPLDVINNWK